MAKKQGLYLKCILFFNMLVLLCPAAFGEENQREQDMFPPRVYVGDRASLRLSLPDLSVSDNIEINLDNLYRSDELDIHRIALERIESGSRLIVEFSAYTPGIIKLPAFSIATEIFEDLTVEISSILELDEMGMVLSDTAAPLAVPGTSFMVFGTIGLIIILLFLGFLILVRGRNKIQALMTAWNRRQLFVSVLKTEKLLRKDAAELDETGLRNILDLLSLEFRNFIFIFTGENCRTMTAAEIGCYFQQGKPLSSKKNLCPPGFDFYEFTSIYSPKTAQTANFLGVFFNSCDKLRFSGFEIKSTDVFHKLDDYKNFILLLKDAIRWKNIRKKTDAKVSEQDIEEEDDT